MNIISTPLFFSNKIQIKQNPTYLLKKPFHIWLHAYNVSFHPVPKNNNIIIRHDSILESIQKQTTKCTRKIHNNHVKKVLQMC